MLEGKQFTLEDVHQTYKAKDAWWTVLLVDPVASRLVVPVANRTNITPNQISLVSFTIGMVAAYCFYMSTTGSLITGAILYHISFILDCMDGKIARLKGTGSMFGVLLDIMLDHIRVVICTVALTFGLFYKTGDYTILMLALLFIFAYFFRHYTALTIYKLRRQMKGRLNKARRRLKRAEKRQSRAELLNVENMLNIVTDEPTNERLKRLKGTYEEQLETLPTGIASASSAVGQETAHTGDRDAGGNSAHIADAVEGTDKAEVVDEEQLPVSQRKTDLQHGFKQKFTLYLRIRDALLTKRIRMHLFSGIEFQMFLFVVAPVAYFFSEVMNVFKGTMLFGSILLLAFELAIIYKLWMSTRDFESEMALIAEERLQYD